MIAKYVQVVSWTIDDGETFVRVFDNDAYEELAEFYKSLKTTAEIFNKKLLASVTTHKVTQRGDST
jgi:hypothetical protein